MKINSAVYENELLHQLREGDRLAFEKLYRHYAPKLGVKILQLLKSEALAQDILQELFIKMWEIRTQIDPERSFAALLYKTATHLSYNAYHRSVREQRLFATLARPEGYSHIEENLAYHETQTLLYQALGKLTERQREIYILHKIEGKSYKEISESLNLGVSSVNWHLQLAYKQLRQSMGTENGLYMLILFYLLSTT